MRVLVLEDWIDRLKKFREWYKAEHDYVEATTADEARRLLAAGPRFDVMFLDHDLAEEHYEGKGMDGEDTGFAVCRYITDSMPIAERPRTFIVHSLNPVGAERMVKHLSTAGLNVYRVPYDRSQRLVTISNT